MPKALRGALERVLTQASRAARAVSRRLEDLSRGYAAGPSQPGVGLSRESGGRLRELGAQATTAGEIIWFHSIDLGEGQPTAGTKSAATLEVEAGLLQLPETLGGLHVLDIGAWDGYFSFEMERRGAASVTALDHYVWSTDHARFREYHAKASAAGEPLLPPDEIPGVWDPVNLPGRAGFDRARAALNSRVRPVVGDFMTMDLDALGEFDIVLFLGVLYHLKDPFTALTRLRRVTRGLAVIETAAAVVPGWADQRLWMFVEGSELDQDPSNWWAPTSAGLAAMCRAAGFSSTHVVMESAEDAPPNPGYSLHYGRVTMHAYV